MTWSADIERRRTPRLLLRKIEVTDRDFLVGLFARPELVAHRPQPIADPPEMIGAQLASDLDHWRAHGHGRWLILRGDHLVGIGGLTVKPGIEGLNVSYHLHPEQWGLGYASEFVTEAVAVGFGDLNAQQIVALIRPANLPSQKVVQRAGFVFERSIEVGGAPMLRFAMQRDC